MTGSYPRDGGSFLFKLRGRITEPLGLNETRLLYLASLLSGIHTAGTSEESNDAVSRMDPYVTMVLAEESPEVQRTIIKILTDPNTTAKIVRKENLRQ